MTTGTELDLATRDGLPDHLRVLADHFARETWDAHSEFGALTKFWLDRHLMFRSLLARMEEDAQALLDGKADPRRYQAALARFGGLFVGQLHEHHTIEDQHYFPMLIGLESRLKEGFDLLDADHHAIDAHLQAFADDANAVLRAPKLDKTQTDRFLGTLGQSHKLLDRHLTDEEDLVVPIILTHGERALS